MRVTELVSWKSLDADVSIVFNNVESANASVAAVIIELPLAFVVACALVITTAARSSHVMQRTLNILPTLYDGILEWADRSMKGDNTCNSRMPECASTVHVCDEGFDVNCCRSQLCSQRLIEAVAPASCRVVDKQTPHPPSQQFNLNCQPF